MRCKSHFNNGCSNNRAAIIIDAGNCDRFSIFVGYAYIDGMPWEYLQIADCRRRIAA